MKDFIYGSLALAAIAAFAWFIVVPYLQVRAPLDDLFQQAFMVGLAAVFLWAAYQILFQRKNPHLIGAGGIAFALGLACLAPWLRMQPLSAPFTEATYLMEVRRTLHERTFLLLILGFGLLWSVGAVRRIRRVP